MGRENWFTVDLRASQKKAWDCIIKDSIFIHLTCFFIPHIYKLLKNLTVCDNHLLILFIDH